AVAWCDASAPMVQKDPPDVTDADRAIAAFFAELVPDGATLQMGIGAVPGLVADMLRDHVDLGIHTELLSDSIMDLIESGAANGRRKTRERFRAATTFALGTQRLYEWIDDNPAVFMLPVDLSNDPRVVAEHERFCAINATMQVDLLGQCASESIGHHYVSSTGGQADFIRGADLAPGGRSFIVTHSTALNGTVSKIVPSLSTGAVVTAHKNLADRVVTEFGVAELKGRSIRERAEALISVAHPDFRDGLDTEAKAFGLL
ncbi:MAG: acetyl-CoA hydrolase/transferase family protein, partial [Actinomycetes bacterium]